MPSESVYQKELLDILTHYIKLNQEKSELLEKKLEIVKQTLDSVDEDLRKNSQATEIILEKLKNAELLQETNEKKLCEKIANSVFKGLETKTNKFIASKTLTIIGYIAIAILVIFEVIKIIGIGT